MNVANLLDSDELASRYRLKAVRPSSKEILISRLAGSEQESDLTVPPNCAGFGRVRHFRNTNTASHWVANPLPIEPARAALRLPHASVMRAQVFQNAVCNWRCWYCYVPFNLLAADAERSGWWTADELVEMYAQLADPSPMIDLTGGQPDLVPEWIPWTMDALRDRKLSDTVYLWSDDNLSNDYFWRFLTDAQIEQVASWKNYGRVCCFKGFDAASFSFNTSAPGSLLDRQFALFVRLLRAGIDLYAYVTLTTPDASSVDAGVRRFVDRLQEIEPNLPLRTVPLEIQIFSPVRPRLNTASMAALDNQQRALEVYVEELERRFPATLRSLPITEISLGGGSKK